LIHVDENQFLEEAKDDAMIKKYYGIEELMYDSVEQYQW
jgi:hypothetical protein